MEIFLSLCLVTVATVLVIWLLSSSGDKTKTKKRLPPGPWTLPIIGSLHHLVGQLPHRALAELSRRHGPLMYLKFGEVPTVVVSSAEAAALVMKTNDPTFADRGCGVALDIAGCGGKGIMLAPYSDRWRQMRKVCIVELLSAAQVRRMASIRAEEVAGLVRSLAASPAGSTVNLSEKLPVLANDIVARAAFGGKCAQQGEYLRELDEVMTLLGGFILADLFPSSKLVRWLGTGERRLRRSCGRIQSIIDNIIDVRRARRAADGPRSTDDEDLLDVLLRLQEEDSLTFPLTAEIIGVAIFDMFAAASETTGTTLEWAMSELLNNPKVMAKAQLEVREVLGSERAAITNSDLGGLHYLQMVIMETLRLHPAGVIILRGAREDCEILGYGIPKGTKVHINVFAISRDSRYWQDPEAFKPERFENNDIDYKGTHFEFIPFGAGRRQCPGILFGMSTLELALANLLYHFDWMIPDAAITKSVDMSEKFGLTVSRRSDLLLRAIPRV
ncbi:hypothetical protein ACQJBY_046489 [Aegilops geniculata]